MVARFFDRVEYFKALLMQDGYPPFSVPIPPDQQYQKLIAWRDGGDPRYWNDASAQKALVTLSQQFGAPPPLVRPPLPPPMQPPRGVQ